jgi:hypothetical protein
MYPVVSKARVLVLTVSNSKQSIGMGPLKRLSIQASSEARSERTLNYLILHAG